ncbi:MAG: hypothetical protein DRH57_04550 [Candidatus Cloacimonadota bacterium]|nr:MAG: hypothetical protein DRH57_04550 [Candidatus Cloacimonadota bacterium]
MIYGIGIDLVEIKRIENSLNKFGSRFINRVFTEKEIEYCESIANKFRSYAVRFAAKEAFFKATGIGWRKGFTLKDVGVLNDEFGRPYLILKGKAKEFTEKMCISNIQLSLSHIQRIATAIVILEK